MDTGFGFQWNQNDEVNIANNHTLPSQVFLWIFMKNMPGMIRCLVNQGFQFRWIEERHLDMMQSRLFEASHYESNPNWTDLDQDELMYCWSSRERCQLRASASYKKQMEMLGKVVAFLEKRTSILWAVFLTFPFLTDKSRSINFLGLPILSLFWRCH